LKKKVNYPIEICRKRVHIDLVFLKSKIMEKPAEIKASNQLVLLRRKRTPKVQLELSLI
jgi:hypothetical protein